MFTPEMVHRKHHFLSGSVLSNHIDLGGGKMFKSVRKSHSKNIKINSECEEEKLALFTLSF